MGYSRSMSQLSYLQRIKCPSLPHSKLGVSVGVQLMPVTFCWHSMVIRMGPWGSVTSPWKIPHFLATLTPCLPPCLPSTYFPSPIFVSNGQQPFDAQASPVEPFFNLPPGKSAHLKTQVLGAILLTFGASKFIVNICFLFLWWLLINTPYRETLEIRISNLWETMEYILLLKIKQALKEFL